MSTQRRFAPGRRLGLLVTAAGLAGLVLFVALFDRAFPAAALDMTLSRPEILARAKAAMARQGFDLGGYQHAVTFDEAGWPSIYLQRLLGVPGTNDLARREKLPLWYWNVRWFKPHQEEEFQLKMMPDGEPVALYHNLPEDEPGATLSQAEAQTLAETYLTGDRGWDLAGWTLVTASSKTQPGERIDHHFEWKRADWQVGDSRLQLSVDVMGDRVGGYGYWLDVPEAFQRQWVEQRGRVGFFNNLSYLVGNGLFAGVALLFFFLCHRRGVFPWYEGVAAGVLVAAVGLLADLNWLSLGYAWYDTTQDVLTFWAYEIGNALSSAGYIAAAVTVLWAGGRALSRRVWPMQDRILPRGEDRWVALGRSVWRGAMLGGVAGGYAVLFYLAAAWLVGGWLPMSTPDVNLYATPLPFLAALSGGVVPAVIEELLFRLIGVGLLFKLTRRRWIALLVPGVLWACAHLAYIRDPVWLRGVELTVVAVFWGLVFLRYGLATTILAHLTYNAALTALPLLRSGQGYFVANGVVVILIILAPAAVGVLRARRLKRLGRAGEEPAIGPLGPADAPALSALDAGPNWAALLARPDAAAVGLWSAGQVVGAAGAQDGVVVGLAVAPGWRRRYWGSRLVLALAECAGTPLRATIPAGDWRLARFWDAVGWRAAASTYAPAQPGRRSWLRRKHTDPDKSGTLAAPPSIAAHSRIWRFPWKRTGPHAPPGRHDR